MHKHKLILTADGCHTLKSGFGDECYHSKNGALNEAVHVFIKAGLKYFLDTETPGMVRILEVGFGTGLNALLTRILADSADMPVHYTTCETVPLQAALMANLNYAELLEISTKTFMALHKCNWEEAVSISPNFTLNKKNIGLENLSVPADSIDIIYFDAFSPDTQPELWTVEIFTALHSLLSENGILVTYSAKGDVKRALKQAGFRVKRLDGPVGKWHMVRAHKV